ncbi:Hypothetical protein HDN1F_19390 [gamma proteobacterium HdN1]|nr:Hypothetical protein HDN1F_19390 [gamma proteobacterium HdN1]
MKAAGSRKCASRCFKASLNNQQNLKRLAQLFQTKAEFPAVDGNCSSSYRFFELGRSFPQFGIFVNVTPTTPSNLYPLP